jgi:hypothetical protein
MADAALALGFGFGDQLADLVARVAVEAVALDDGGVDLLAPEDAFEGVLHRGGARAR